MTSDDSLGIKLYPGSSVVHHRQNAFVSVWEGFARVVEVHCNGLVEGPGPFHNVDRYFVLWAGGRNLPVVQEAIEVQAGEPVNKLVTSRQGMHPRATP